MDFSSQEYKKLGHKEKKSLNHEVLKAKLALHRFNSSDLLDDFDHVDFIASQIEDGSKRNVKISSVPGIWKKYRNQDLWIGIHYHFKGTISWYVYPHDEFLNWITINKPSYLDTPSWNEKGKFHAKKGYIVKAWFDFLADFQL